MSDLNQKALESVKLTHDAASRSEILTNMLHNAAKTAPCSSSIYMMGSAGLGKLFAPPPGDWRRSSG